MLQDDHCSSSSPPPKSRYNPLSFINPNNGRRQHSNRNRSTAAAVVVDCGEDEQFIAYGSSKCDHHQQPSSTASKSAQYIMSVSSSLPAVTGNHPHHTSDRSCDPITVPSEDQEEDMDVPNSSDHVMSGDTSSDHVMSSDSGDPTTTQCNSSVKRKRRKLLNSKCLVSNWQPSPISVEGESSGGLAVITRSKQNSTSTSSPITINSASTHNASPITVEDHNLVSSHDLTTTERCGSPTAGSTCDLTSVEGCGLPDSHDHTHKSTVGMVTNDVSSNRGEPVKNKISSVSNSNSQSFTRSSLTSVKSTRTFYNQSGNRHRYNYAPFGSSKLL